MPTHCDGCLGYRRCWVCLGNGLLDGPDRLLESCQRCRGTGRCPLCQEVARR